MNISDIQDGLSVATFVCMILAIAFIVAALIGIIFGQKLLWAVVVALLCGALGLLCCLTESFLDSL